MRRIVPVVLALAALGGVVAYRLHARSKTPEAAQNQIVRTGRSAPVELGPLPPGLKVDGTFRCFELTAAKPPVYMAEATGGTLRNVSGRTLAVSFTLTARVNSTSQSVSRDFTMTTTDTLNQFQMRSKTIPRGLDSCRLVFTLGGGNQVADLAKAGGCVAADPPDLGRNHIEPPAKGTYNSVPPTSGSHYPSPAKTGVHRAAIPNEYQVHNLEHGHIGLQYGAIPNAVRARLEAKAQSDDRWIFVAPYAKAKFAVALTAWDHVTTCKTVPPNLDALIGAFISAYKDHAPESIPGKPV